MSLGVVLVNEGLKMRSCSRESATEGGVDEVVVNERENKSGGCCLMTSHVSHHFLVIHSFLCLYAYYCTIAEGFQLLKKRSTLSLS